MSNRSISWSAALRDLKSDRTRREDVREERLRSTGGLNGSAALPLSAWRGRSGRRYVVGVHATAAHLLDADAPFVALAVTRAAGLAERHVVAAIETPADLAVFLIKAGLAGATEIHVHRLADGEAERAAVVEDLKLDPDAALITAARARGAALAADLCGAR